MSSDQEISYGTMLQYDSTGSSNWVEIGEVKDFSGPSYKRKSIPLGAIKDTITRKKSGRLDAGDVTLKFGYNKTIYGLFVTFIKAKAKKTFRFTMPETSTESFSAEVIAVTKSGSDEEGLTFDVTLDIDNDTTYTAAA